MEADDFRAALDSGRYAEVHRQALRRARQLQISVVPTFLIDSRRLEGMPAADSLNRLLTGAAVVR